MSLKVHLWNIAGDVFNMREAKRLFGLIAVGGTLVTPLAGLSVVALTQLIGVKNLLWIVALAMLICIACVAISPLAAGRAAGGAGRAYAARA